MQSLAAAKNQNKAPTNYARTAGTSSKLRVCSRHNMSITPSTFCIDNIVPGILDVIQFQSLDVAIFVFLQLNSSLVYYSCKECALLKRETLLNGQVFFAVTTYILPCLRYLPLDNMNHADSRSSK